MDYHSLSNDALLNRLRELAMRDRGVVSDFIACLAEADRRPEAIIGEGYPSLFEFCVRDLKLAESTAYQRVKAAKLVRIRPEILGLLADGSVNLSNLCLIAPRLEEHPELLSQIVGKSKREVEALLASFGVPREIPDRIRALGSVAPIIPESGLLFFPEASQAATGSETSSIMTESDKPVPALEMRTEFRFAAGPGFVGAVERLRAMLWHKHPAGRLEDLLYEAASDFIARRDPAREPKGSPRRSPPARARRARRISAAVRRVVWMRDGGRCCYSGPAGPCGESRGLEIDHRTPWAMGGSSDEVSNLRLLCRAHNQSEAVRIFRTRASLPG